MKLRKEKVPQLDHLGTRSAGKTKSLGVEEEDSGQASQERCVCKGESMINHRSHIDRLAWVGKFRESRTRPEKPNT